MTSLRDQFNKIKRNPEVGIFSMILDLKKDFLEEMRAANLNSGEAIKTFTENYLGKLEISLRDKTEKLSLEVKTEVKRFSDELLDSYEEKKEEITDSFLTKVSEITEEALNKIEDHKSNSLKGVDGKDADETLIVSKILEQIPKPKDGTDAVLPDIHRMINENISMYFLQNPIKEISEESLESRLLEKLSTQFDPKIWAEAIARAMEELPYPKKLDYDTGLKNKPGISTSGKRPMLRGGSGTGTSNTFVENEVVAGSGTAFTLAATPVSGSVKLYANGQRLFLTTDYTIIAAAITTVDSRDVGELLADYRTS